MSNASTAKAERPAPTAEEPAPAAKKPRTGHPSDAPGYCSAGSPALSAEQVCSVLERTGEQVLSEKSLVGKGTRELVKPAGDLIVELADRKAKYVTKDAERLLAMRAVAQQQLGNMRCVLLLGKEQQFCRSRTLPRLLEAGVIVQRLEA